MSSTLSSRGLLPSTLPTVSETFGPLLIGFMVSAPLFGLVFYQAWNYFRLFGWSDTRWVRYSVIVVCLLEITNQILACHALYYYFIVHEANVQSISYLVWSLVLPAGLTGLQGFIVNCFSAHRVFIMSGRRHFPLMLLYPIILTSLAFAAFDCIQGLRFPDILKHPPTDAELAFIPASFGTIAGNDLLITLALSYCLFRGVQDYHEDRTRHIVYRVILLTVNNGVFVSGVAMGAFLTKLACAMPTPALALGSLILGKAYANMLLSSLNSRHTSRELLKQVDNSPNAPTASFAFAVATNPMFVGGQNPELGKVDSYMFVEDGVPFGIPKSFSEDSKSYWDEPIAVGLPLKSHKQRM